MANDSQNSTQEEMNNLLVQLLQNETSKEVIRLRNLLLERVALETQLQAPRVPAPTSITEIGGYYNLLKHDDLMRRQLLASILGLPYQTNK